MRAQTSYRTRRALNRLERTTYHEQPRHPVRIVSFARDPQNIGGIVRTAEAFMVEMVYGFMEPRYTAVGTERWQPAMYGADLAWAATLAQSEGYVTVALEQTNDAQLLPCALPKRICLIVGDESSGIPPATLTFAEMAIEIPQQGLVGSLNVVTATSIALYEWMTQHGY